MDLRTLTPGTFEPVSMAEVFQHCRIDGDPDDIPVHEAAVLPVYVRAARAYVERFTGVLLTDAVYQLRLPSFRTPIRFPVGPVGSVERVEYVDQSGALQELAAASFLLDGDLIAPALMPGHGLDWPASRAESGAVRITFRGRYTAEGGAEPVPDDLKQALLLLIGHWYENREEVVVGTITSKVPMAADMLLQLHRRDMGV